jgi:hypothetical protein
MSPREPKCEGAQRILEVTVRAQPDSTKPILPKTLTLTDSVLIVVWRCDDLPPDGRLVIVFEKDPRGPFFFLECTGREVIGWGNRGPETARRYAYEARIETGTEVGVVIGGGNVRNQATKPVPSFTVIYPPREPIDQPD